MELPDYLFDTRVISLLIGIFVPFILYWYSTRNHDYWKKRGIPFAKTYPLFGSYGEILTKDLEDVEIERYKKFGKMYGVLEGSVPSLIISDPKLIKDILVKDFQYFSTRRHFISGNYVVDQMLTVLKGENWKRVRTIVSPTFSTGKIKMVMSIFIDCSKTMIQHFKLCASKEVPVDIVKIYGGYSLDVIASSAFSTKIDIHNDPKHIFVKMAMKLIGRLSGSLITLQLLIPGILRLFKKSTIPFEATEFFKNVILKIIQERQETGQKRNDFLQLLLDAASEAETGEKCEEKSDDLVNYGDDHTNHPIFKGTSYKHITKNELIAQCVIFFLAGYHTTTATVSLATYLLARNPDVQEKLFKEIKDVLEETNGELKYESVLKMKYLDNVISETLRIYSVVLRLERTAEVDYKLGDTGYTIPKGMKVGFPVYAMHRDQKFFPEPERFNPDRFKPEERGKQIPYTYLPFGAGPRNCVGMRFGIVETKVALIHVFSAFHVKTCPEIKVEVEFHQGQGLVSPNSIMVPMEARKNCPLKNRHL